MDLPHPDRLVENATAPLREALRSRMGRSPAEIAEGAEDSLGWGMQLHRSCFQQLPWSSEAV